jgi:hypothetical protein
VPDQQVDHRGPAQSARNLLAESGEPSDQVQVHLGAGGAGLIC